MKKPLLLLTALLLQAPAWAAITYTFTGPAYASTTAPLLCGSPPCPSFTTAMHQSGSFTTLAPLAAGETNLDISGLITAYDFNDGITHYTSSDANGFLMTALATTDGAGNILTANITVAQWRTASHGANDRLSAMGTPVNAQSWSNVYCQTPGPQAGTCTQLQPDASTSEASVSTVGTWATSAAVPVPAVVPALGPWGLPLLGVLMGVAAWVRRRS